MDKKAAKALLKKEKAAQKLADKAKAAAQKKEIAAAKQQLAAEKKSKKEAAKKEAAAAKKEAAAAKKAQRDAARQESHENFVIKLKELVVAVVVLVLIIAICVLVYLLITKFYLRFFWFTHGESKFLEFMNDYILDVTRCFRSMRTEQIQDPKLVIETFYKTQCLQYPLERYINEWENMVSKISSKLTMIAANKYFTGDEDKAAKEMYPVITLLNNMLHGNTLTEFKKELFESFQNITNPVSYGSYFDILDKVLEKPIFKSIVEYEKGLIDLSLKYPILRNFRLKPWMDSNKIDIDLFKASHMIKTDSDLDDVVNPDRITKLKLYLDNGQKLYDDFMSFEKDVTEKQKKCEKALDELFALSKEDLLLEEGTIDDVPDFALTIMLPNIIRKKSPKGMGRTNLFLENIGAGDKIQKHIDQYYEKSEVKAEFTDKAMEKFGKLLEAIIKVREATQEFRELFDTVQPTLKLEDIGKGKRFTTLFYDKKRVATLELAMLLNEYWGDLKGRKNNTIVRLSMFRQYGGMFNFTLVWLFVQDYFDFCVMEKIVPEWVQFPKNYLDRQQAISDWMLSPPVIGFFTTIPQRFAGVTNSNSDGDTVETFVGALMKIAGAFVAIGEVFMAIINVITDPVAFIKYLFGIIIAIGLLLAWLILAFPVFTYAYAAVIQVFVSVFKTLLFAIVWILFSTLFLVISIFDIFLGGAIMRALRCENLPNMWHTRTNWHKGNKHDRSLFCSYPCRKGFYPFMGLVCIANSKHEPTYAPHQLVYSAFKKENYLASQRHKMLYNFKFNKIRYMDMSSTLKIETWKYAFENEQEYIKDIREKYKRYEKLVQGICTINKEKNKQLEEVCNSIFCSTDVENPVFCPADPGVSNSSPYHIDLVFLKVLIVSILLYIVVKQYYESILY
jgi:hypothetical protein